MLTELYIRDFVLIEELRVAFGPGLTVLTGETGAGKSVVLGALGLILGGRTDTDLIRRDRTQATIEGVFGGIGDEFAVRLDRDFGIPAEDGGLIIRRQIHREGRGRCFVNGVSVTLAVLKEIARGLIDIHGQHEHQALLETAHHVQVLDRYGVPDKTLAAYRDALARYRGLAAELKKLRDAAARSREQQDLREFQLEELTQADLTVGEDTGLEGELSRLENAERIAELSAQLNAGVSQDDRSLVSFIATLQRMLDELARLDPRAVPGREYLEGARINAEELASFIQDYHDGFEYDPSRLDEVRERVDLLDRFKKKYTRDLDGLIAFRDELAEHSADAATADIRIGKLEAELDPAREGLEKTAAALSAARKKTGAALGKRVEAGLGDVRMEDARFGVIQTPRPGTVNDTADETGTEDIEFYIATNPGEPLRPLVKIASGGEMSRLMLVLKDILAGTDRVPTVVFDEIDVGISGQTAHVVGEKMQRIAGERQVLCITHLPQIASLADSHMTVIKKTVRGRAVISLVPLGREERKAEIARLLSGKENRETSLKHAEELLKGSGTV